MTPRERRMTPRELRGPLWARRRALSLHPSSTPSGPKWRASCGQCPARSAPQAPITSPPSTLTPKGASGDGAGPLMFLPVSASNTEPWQGQLSLSPVGATVHPLWVHLARKPATVPAAGWAMMISVPSAVFAETAPPTGTSASLTRLAPAVGSDVGAAEPLAAPADGVDPPSPPLSPQAPSSVAARVATPTPRTGRLVNDRFRCEGDAMN